MGLISIIADDLTGASDTGIQFRKQGFKTKVIVNPETLNEFLGSDEILSINTNTRPLKKEKAYAKVYEICYMLKNAGLDRLYKKVDSTFRGNPGIELEAVMDAMDSNLAILVPSYPDNGRFMVNGYLKVKLTHASINEEAKPTGTCVLTKNKEYEIGHIPTIVQQQMRRKVANIDLEIVQSGHNNILNEISRLQNKGYEVITIDAVTKNDLDNISVACKSLPETTIMSGAAGFASYLPKIISLSPSEALDNGVNEGIILIIAGTCNQVTRVQIEEVLENFDAELIQLDTHSVSCDTVSKEIQKVVSEIEKATKPKQTSTIIVAVDTLFIEGARIAKDKGKIIASAFGEIVSQLLDKKPINGFIITGGDTALHVLNALETKAIELENEVLAGIPAGWLIGGKADNIQIVTKAGGFGTPAALLTAIDYLQNNRYKKKM
ncbi:MAG TPA: four-carbon acid sugar kinase family protein [Tepidanaerobacter syntrophicus]|uniref:four-carbon acid sugar kinase family protein n=1 Tax=Tepidanaerobacter syntrophicus TaxID=224999 RepID=UPI001752BEF1|nr:four-carbon acid sugar kinase family protein [Tepidanaerobacter syntrophicus]HHV83339.1 four-carbon acid sugar kinase family protein [Tepidanaerobacter syntrophicus]